MRKAGRRKGHKNKGYFFRKGRGWVASDNGRMAPLTLPDGSALREREIDDTILKEAHARWLMTQQTAQQAAQAGSDVKRVTVEDVCLAYLANAKANGAEQTYEVRADTPFDFCFGLPPRFRAKDGTPKRLTNELRKEAAKARIHAGFERLSVQELIPLHIDQWLNAHKNWGSSAEFVD